MFSLLFLFGEAIGHDPLSLLSNANSRLETRAEEDIEQKVVMCVSNLVSDSSEASMVYIENYSPSSPLLLRADKPQVGVVVIL